MYKETEELVHGQSTIPQTEVSISDLEKAMAEFLGVSCSPRPQAVQSSPSALTKNSTRKPKSVRVSNVFLDGAFADIEMNGTETSTKRNTANKDSGDQLEDEELRAFCRRMYGPSLDRWRNGISASLRQTTMKILKKIRNSVRSLVACTALQLTGWWNGNSALTLMATQLPLILPLKIPPRRLHRAKSANRRSDPEKA